MNIEEEEDSCRLYKILLLGDSSVGKSCLLLRYCDDSFQDIHLATIGLDFRLKTINLENNKKIKAQIWDTAGQDRFRAITKNYYRGANGILLIFDITDRSSFEHIRNWIEQIKEEAPEQIIIYLVGNKIDNENNRVVTNEEAKKLAEEFKLKYFETSAKNSINVDTTFLDLIKEIDSLYSTLDVDNNGMTINRIKKTRKRCCN
jgi:small GTP-binding protein